MPLGLPAPSSMSPGALGRTGNNPGSRHQTYVPPPTPPNPSGGRLPTGGYTTGGQPLEQGQPHYIPPRGGMDTPSPGTTTPQGSGGIPQAKPATPVPMDLDTQRQAYDSAQAMNEWYKQQAYMSQAYSNASMQDAWLRTAENIDYLNMGRDHINATYGNDQAMLAAQREQQVDLVAKQLGVDRTYAEAIWRNMQQDIGNRRGTAAEQLAIQNWLTGQNKKHTGTERDLAFARNRAEFDTRWRNLGYAATAAGSYTSAGHRADRQDAKINAFLGNANANLGYDRSMDSLRAGERTDALGYRSTLDALQNQWNNGYAGYNRDIAGNNISMQGVGNTGRQFDIRGNQLGLDRQNALNQNAWNQSQAAWQGRGTMQQQAQQQAQYLANLAAQAFG